MKRSKPWEIAADIEAAAKAITDASILLDAIHISALPEVEAIPSVEFVNRDMAKALQAISDKYQAVADAEEEPLGTYLKGTVCQPCGKAGLLMCDHVSGIGGVA